MKILVCISGASGVKLGLKLYKSIGSKYDKYLIISDNSKIVLEKEENKIFNDNDISAPPASGSFKLDVTIILPCSMNTLAKISTGIADNLITRSAQVAIKERKKLIISPREMPFSSIYLEHMLKLSKIGVVIAPPIFGYYAKTTSIEDMENFVIGRILDFANIDNNLYKRWDENNE